MYKVQFYDYVISQFPSVEPALAFALNLHSASNVKHDIYVVKEVGDDSEDIVKLSLSEDVKGASK